MTDKKEILKILQKAIEDDDCDINVIPINASNIDGGIEGLKDLFSQPVPELKVLADMIERIKELDCRPDAKERAENTLSMVQKAYKEDNEVVCKLMYKDLQSTIKTMENAYKPTKQEIQDFMDAGQLALHLLPEGEMKQRLEDMLDGALISCPSKELWHQGIKQINEIVDVLINNFKSSQLPN